MIHNRSFVPMNPDKKEINELEHSPFDFIANEGNIHSYAASLIPSHWHRELEIFILLEGRVRIGAGSETFEVVPGEGCFINTGILHSFACLVPSPCRYRSFVFDAGIVSGTPGSIFDTRYIRPLLENGPAYLKFEHPSEYPAFFRDFDAAFSACANEETGYEFEVRAAVSRMLLLIGQQSEMLPHSRPSSLQDTRAKQLLPWIDANLERNLSIKEIAAVINVCPRVCQRLFRQYFHCTPMEYLQEKRLLLAAEKLISTDLPVTDIALSCGFSSPSYFTKQFRELIGKTPSVYREERKNS